MKRVYKKIGALIMAGSLAISMIPVNEIQAAAKNESGKQQTKKTYLVQMQSQNQALQLEKNYEEADTVSSLSEESMHLRH